MSAKPCARLPELGLHFPCLIQFICMNAIISCSNTENTIYSKMVLYMDHMKIYIPLVAISNVCICHRQRLDVYGARSPANQSQFHGWIDGIPDFMTAHPASSSGSDSTKPPDNSDNISRLHTLILSCNIYEHVAMARETNEPHRYIFYTHIHFALPSWATSRAMHGLYRCVAGQQPPFWAKI